jgi:DNA repair protein RecN (Recombination protein N)
MLTDLHIKDVVLIENLALSFGDGFAALTGETGAGKSILLDALGLALGARASAGLIRQGADSAHVTASFEVTDKRRVAMLHEYLDEQALGFNQPLVLRRVVQKDGKSKAFLNDQPVSLTVLKAIGEMLVEIHGQFETQDLLETKTHRTTLDAFAGNDALLKSVREAWEEWRDAVAALAQLEADLKDAARQRDLLQSTVDELQKLAPKENEEEQLAAQRSLMMHAEKILASMAEAENALDHDQGARARLHSALRSLERAAEKMGDGLDPTIQGLNQALIEVDEAIGNLSVLAANMAFDAQAQSENDERLFSLRGAARKYQVNVAQLPEVLDKAANDLRALDDQSGLLAKASKAVAVAEKEYQSRAEKLSVVRKIAAKKLTTEIMAELPPLKLERARFEAEVATAKAPGADGIDAVTFMVSTNTGMELAPLHKVASGGEMARLMLALKLVTQQTDATPTLIFDEIDTGVAGAVAESIGLRLRRLGSAAQVFAVTHAPQVASKAHHHFRIEKTADKKTTRTHVAELDHNARVTEIARLLSGEKITDAAKTAAEHLLEVEEAPKKKLKKAKKA